MKKQASLFIIADLFCLVTCKQAREPKETQKIFEKYEANWESLKRYECPEWFSDAKFGIYTHWGTYSVPSWENEWYPRLMYMKDNDWGKRFYEHHKETWGDPSGFGYKDFIPLFKAEKFNAEEWAELFKKSGAQFAGPVAEHHDGFAMWNSDLTEWDAKDKGSEYFDGKIKKVEMLGTDGKSSGNKRKKGYWSNYRWKNTVSLLLH